MALQPRRRGETQAQYRRRVGNKRPQTVGTLPRPAPIGRPKTGGPLPPTRVRIRPKRPLGGATPLNPITGRPQPIQFTTPPSRPRIPPPQQGVFADTLTQEQHQALIKAQTDLYNKRMQDPEFQRQQKLMMERMNKQRPLREQFLKGEITVKDLRGSGLFTPQQLREARTNRRMQRMSPEERLNFMRREAERRKRRLGRRRRTLGLGTANRPLKPKPQRPRRVMPRRGMQSLELRPQRRRVRRRVR
tara:strand:+ start:27 stop:764 length:738 start_codon:yes stop_codon:yes gene_type:complete